MEPNINVLIVGVGGQGTLLTSRIIAQAVVNLGYEVKVSEVHGMAQRGGSVVTQVRFGREVYSPIISEGEADVILAFEPIEGARWLKYLKPGGTVIVNDEKIDPLPVLSGKVKYPQDILQKIKQEVPSSYVFNCSEVAQVCGNRRAANVVMVGILSQIIALDPENLLSALSNIVPSKALEINQLAFQKGIGLMSA